MLIRVRSVGSELGYEYQVEIDRDMQCIEQAPPGLSLWRHGDFRPKHRGLCIAIKKPGFTGNGIDQNCAIGGDRYLVATDSRR